jgi:type IV secretory pathway VirB4 component
MRAALASLFRSTETRRPGLSTTTAQAEAIYLPSAEPGLGTRGVLIGKELYSGQGVVYDPFEMYGDALPGPNALILGDVGNGKSALTKTYLLRQIRFGRQVAVLDSKNQRGEGEYAKLARALGATPIRLVPGADSHSDRGRVRLNPLDPAIAPDRQLSLLRTIAQVALDRRLEPREGDALMRAHARVVDAASATREQPTLPEVVAALLSPTDADALATATTVERLLEDGRDVAIELNRLCEGDLRGMFDGPTTAGIDLDAPLTVFDLSALDADGEALPILMACIGVWLQFVWVRPDGRKRIFVVEEGWHVIGNLYTARLFRRLWKLARGLGLQNIAVVHHLSDLTAGGGAAADAVNALLEEAQTRIVYRQSTKETRSVARDLGLSESAVRQVPDLPRGCALWVVGTQVRLVQHVMTDYERELVLTDDAMQDDLVVPDFDRPVGCAG